MLIILVIRGSYCWKSIFILFDRLPKISQNLTLFAGFGLFFSFRKIWNSVYFCLSFKPFDTLIKAIIKRLPCWCGHAAKTRSAIFLFEISEKDLFFHKVLKLIFVFDIWKVRYSSNVHCSLMIFIIHNSIFFAFFVSFVSR